MTRERLLAAWFWGARRESAEQCARRWLVFLERLAALDDQQLLRGWLDTPDGPPEELQGVRIEPLPLTLPELTRLVEQGALDDPGGFGFGISNGEQGGRRVGFAGTCGGYTTAEGYFANKLFLELGVEAEADVLRWARLAEEIVVALAEEWEPDWGYLGTRTLRDQQERGHREPWVGYVTYLSAGRCQAIPAALAAKSRRTRDGGVVVSLIDKDGGLPQPQRVLEAAQLLRAAGVLTPTPVRRARLGDPEVPTPPQPPGEVQARETGGTTTLRLALKYDPVPENASAFAADIVAAARELSKVNLDYSAASLGLVDGIFADLREQGESSGAIAETLFGFGCYVGEVLVRHAGGWWDTPRPDHEADHEMDWAVGGYPLLVRLPSGGWANPISNAFDSYESSSGSVAFFYDVITTELTNGESDGQVPEDG